LNASNTILERFSKRTGQIAVLIDPEKLNQKTELQELLRKADFVGVDY